MLRTVLADFRAFIAAPRLITPSPMRGGWSQWGIMVGTYLAGLIVLSPLLALWGRTFHLSAAAAFSGFSPPVLAAVVVLVAPPAEEVLFRGWLTGRPRALWLLATAVIGTALLATAMRYGGDTVVSLAMVAIVLAALAGWLWLRRRSDPPAWFARSFGGWFYASVLMFGLLHMMNYHALSWTLLPMVLPQLWAGLVFAYLRMRHGLWASSLAHAIGNAALLAAALLSGH
jgi:membrane protease YdiL (CAAX protease family)